MNFKFAIFILESDKVEVTQTPVSFLFLLLLVV